jgi:hypothetical protein
VKYSISVHRYNIGHTRSREREWEGERHDKSLIEVFMDKVITLYFIDFCPISFLSLHHRECNKKEDYSSGNSKVFSFESKKSEEVLSQKVSTKHSDQKYKPKTSTILTVVSLSGIRVETSIKRKCRKWLKEGNKGEKHGANKSDIQSVKHSVVK